MRDFKDLTSGIFACKRDELDDNVILTDLENWDSLKHMEYIISLEKEYNISLTGDEIASLKKIGTVEALIKEKLKGAKDSKNANRG